MKLDRLLIVAFIVCLGVATGTVWANPQLAMIPNARANMDIQAPFMMQGEKMPYSHEITVVLPASYGAKPDQTYPVLWVLDAPLMLRMVVGTVDTLVIGNLAPEMIIVGIGSRSEDGLAGVGRRVVDFSPPGPDYFPEGLGGEAWETVAPLPEFPHLADDFLAFLVDELRPELASRYRFAGDHALFGHSAGGMFAAYSLFSRPGAFDKLLIGSPYLNGVRGAVFAAEQKYAEEHTDLAVSIFIGAGDAELQEYFLAASGIVSSTARFTETLRLRQYGSMQLESRIFPGKNHYTVVPEVLMEGIGHLWADQIRSLPSSWPQPKP